MSVLPSLILDFLKSSRFREVKSVRIEACKEARGLKTTKCPLLGTKDLQLLKQGLSGQVTRQHGCARIQMSVKTVQSAPSEIWGLWEVSPRGGV